MSKTMALSGIAKFAQENQTLWTYLLIVGASILALTRKNAQRSLCSSLS